MWNKHKVAVIVPVYNTGAAKLRACICSILRQTFKDFALVLVDDGSTDGSGVICDEYAKKDSRVTVIHQPNSGSVNARKAGIFSERAQRAEYICMCDSDDVMPKKALEKLVMTAEQTQADCVCGNTSRMYRGITIPSRFVPPMFSDGKAKVYSNATILSDLYISCFGISNYPVSLCAKLYETKLITEASSYDPVVRFMGDDLSVTLRVLPKTQQLAIIPDIVYNYRIGGGTSKFMPHMLDDFLALYRFKREMAREYPMPQNAEYLMAVEMKNVLLTWLEMCAVRGGYDKNALLQEAVRVCALPDIQYAVRQKDLLEKQPGGIRKAIQDRDAEEVCTFVYERIHAGKFRRFVKSVLK